MGLPADDGAADQPSVARAGARFPSAKALDRYSDEPMRVPRGERHESTQSRPTGARFPTEKQIPDREPEEQPTEPALPAPPPEPVMKPSPVPRPRPQPRFDEGVAAEDADGPRVRPYVLTGGRTQARYELALETMVSLRADGNWSGPALGSEYQPVRMLCRRPQSVAEVAAALSVPLGVARVLISDMAELGLLHIHGTERTAEGRPPMALMRRVLDGLQRL
ncbi:MAG TPA: DUF742 domain-containing protein [Amycolatopsis sp.]|nr:DUF742 domain-containing protein [Amycolatopsis sp.]